VKIPTGTMDCLQPLGVGVNKAAKDFLQEYFRQWYAGEVEKLFMDKSTVNVDMGMSCER